MRAGDRGLRRWRYRKLLPHVRGRCLDVGAHDGSLLERLDPEHSHVGLEPRPPAPAARSAHRLVARWQELDPAERFDTITCLATYEHLSDPAEFWRRCAHHLAPHGRLLMTVPRPLVDDILALAVRLRLLAGMDHHAHRCVSDDELRRLPREHQLEQICSLDFMLGLNRLLVYRHQKTS